MFRNVALFFVIGWGAVLANLPVEVKVGQVFMANAPLDAEFLDRTALGHLILYGWMHQPEDIPLLREMVHARTGLEPLIACDQEGGRVQAFRLGYDWPANGGIATVQEAFEKGRGIGEELAQIGVDMDLAPVVDLQVGYIGDRAFSSEPEEVVAKAGAFIEGLRPVRSCLKHFPGHGAGSGDSHQVTPRAGGDIGVHLEPFRALIGEADAIMTCHIVVPEIDAQRPATLSPEVIGVLRGWGFDGPIITDSLVMQGVGMRVGKAAIEAFKAGCDLLLIGGHGATPEVIEEAIGEFRAAVEGGAISEERLDESIKRIRSLK